MTINRNIVIKASSALLVAALLYIGITLIAPLAKGEKIYRDKISGTSFRYPSYFGDPKTEKSFTIFDSEKYRISFRSGSFSEYSTPIEQVKSEVGKEDHASIIDLPNGLKSYVSFKISKEKTGKMIAIIPGNRNDAVEISVASKEQLIKPTDEGTFSEISDITDIKELTTKIISSLEMK